MKVIDCRPTHGEIRIYPGIPHHADVQPDSPYLAVGRHGVVSTHGFPATYEGAMLVAMQSAWKMARRCADYICGWSLDYDFLYRIDITHRAMWIGAKTDALDTLAEKQSYWNCYAQLIVHEDEPVCYFTTDIVKPVQAGRKWHKQYWESLRQKED